MMQRKPKSTVGHVLLVDLASAPLPDGHLHLDRAMTTLPDFDPESLCMLFQGKWVQVSILHPAKIFDTTDTDGSSGQDLGPSILNMQNIFDCIIIFFCPKSISRAVSGLAVVAPYLRKPVIFVSNKAESAVADLASALRFAAARIIEGIAAAEILFVVNGEQRQVG